MTSPKPPTPQSISALLRKAGLPRSQRTGGRHGAPIVSEGFHVTRSSFAPPAAVDVRYRPGDAADELLVQRAGIEKCAEVLTAAGLTVSDKRHKLVIVAAPSPEGETR